MTKRVQPAPSVFVLVLAPVLLLLLAIIQSLYHGSNLVRTRALVSESSELRGRLSHRLGRLEQYFHTASTETTVAISSPDLNDHFSPELNDEAIRQTEWPEAAELKPPETYWAIVDSRGNVVQHSHRREIGKREAEQPVLPLTNVQDVARISASPLSAEQDAYDLKVPAKLGKGLAFTLHSGFDAREFDRKTRQLQSDWIWSQMWYMLPLVALDVTAAAGVIYLLRHCRAMQSAISEQKTSETKMLAQLGVGLAHEVRNPLHALRINLHTLKRSLTSKLLSEREMVEMMQESNDEIDRMDVLIRHLVQYTAPRTQESPADIELERETRATLQLLSEEIRRLNVAVTFPQGESTILVRMSPTPLRMILNELLTFSHRSAAENGKIDIQLQKEGDRVRLSIVDTGRELSSSDLSKLFEPFHSTPNSNAGLALALTRRYVEEAGGSLQRIQSSGANRFVLDLPLAPVAKTGGTT